MEVESFTRAISLLVVMIVAAITPGPNNLIVLSLASREGAKATIKPILGVVVGSMAMFLVIWWAGELFLTRLPGLRLTVGIVGCGYLAWLGVSLIRHAGKEEVHRTGVLPRGVLPLAILQLINPKTWMFVAAVVAAGLSTEGDLLALPLLLVAVPLVMVACLSVWAGAGSLLARLLERGAAKATFDRLMGVALLVSAPLVIL